MNTKLISTIAIIVGVVLITTGYASSDVYAQEAASSANDSSMKFIGAGIAFGLAALGAGYAIGGVGAAGLAAITERPELKSQALVFTALGEAIAIYGIVVAIIILGS